METTSSQRWHPPVYNADPLCILCRSFVLLLGQKFHDLFGSTMVQRPHHGSSNLDRPQCHLSDTQLWDDASMANSRFSTLAVAAIRLDLELRRADQCIEAALVCSQAPLPHHSNTNTVNCCFLALCQSRSSIVIALLGLTYSVDQGRTVHTRPGQMSVLDLSNTTTFQNMWYYGNEDSPTLLYADQSDLDFKSFPGLAARPFNGTGANTTFMSWYNFQDRSPDNPAIYAASSRQITSTANCNAWNYTQINNNSIGLVDSNNRTFQLGIGNIGSYTHRKVCTNSTSWTNYIYDTQNSCGDRCAVIYIIQSPGSAAPGRNLFCEYTNTISSASESQFNPADAAHSITQLSNNSSSTLLAASIATLYDSNSQLQVHVQYSNSDLEPMVFYDIGWTACDLGYFTAQIIASFSMTALAAADQDTEIREPRIDLAGRRNITGREPYYPSQVSVSWVDATAVLIVVPLLQLLGLLIMIAFANKSIVKDNANFTTARILGPIVQRMGEHGSLFNGDDIMERLGGDEVKLIYVSEVSGVATRVGVFEQKDTGGFDIGLFPEGRYD